MKDELYNAYRKLKSYLANDKTLLEEKLQLAYFEQNIDDNIEKLVDNIKKRTINELFEKIDYTLVLKKIKNEQEFLSSSIYTNQTIQDKYDIESYNIFIQAPIEIHLIATLWSMTVGEQLDKSLLDEIKGNRLFREKDKTFNTQNYKLFKPYFEGYQSFRDDALDMAISLHRKNLNVTFVNLDITEFYYNIPFSFIKDLPPEIEDKFQLNEIMQQVHDRFHQIITKDGLQPKETSDKDKLQPKKGNNYKQENFLPIGLVSSSIIANYVLKEFDDDIVENVKPEYYSRYVDDMIMVFSNSSINIEEENAICKLLESKTKKTIFSCSNSSKPNDFTTNERRFIFQQDKVKVFHFYRNDSIILLEKFKETIDKNSSFFNFMPDDEKLFKILENSTNILFYNDSENKISSLIGATKDTLKISRNLTGVINTVSSANFDKKQLLDYNQQLKNVFSGKNILILRLYWQRVFEYLVAIDDYNLVEEIYKDFLESIEKISHKNQQERLKEDTKRYLMNSVKFAYAMKGKNDGKS
jgi:hypothetical protein